MTSSCKWLSHSHTCTHFSKEGGGGEGAVGLTLCEAPTCETRPDHYTGTSVPYSLRQLCGFFNVPCWRYDTEDAGDRAYNLSPVSKKTRTSPAWQSGALPTELTSPEMTWHHIACENILFLLALRCLGRSARRNVCDSATEIPYWWCKICPESDQKRWLVDRVVTLF